MRIIKAHHYGFTVSEVERSVRFYRDVLGLKLVRISDRVNIPSYDTLLGYRDVRLRIAVLTHPVDEFVLELVQYVNPPGRPREMENYFLGASHVAYEVDDVDALHAKLQAAGHRAINPPTDVIRDGRCVARAMYALDPDGISIEIFQEYEDVVKQ